MSDQVVISATGVGKSFHENGQDLHILRDVSLSVSRGEVVAVVGVSGSGKSTLLAVLGTLDHPDAGTLRIAGEDPSRLDDTALSRLRSRTLGFVFQFHHLLPDLDAQENVALAARIAGLSRNDARERAIQLLEQSGLSDRIRHRPAQLSGGERQRVALARALANSPAVVLADEPTGNLDPANAQALLTNLRNLSQLHRQAFVVATHDPNLAAGADRRLRIEDGRLEEIA
jgi:lipoprotein-releasing system ATP-binding protein